MKTLISICLIFILTSSQSNIITQNTNNVLPLDASTLAATNSQNTATQAGTQTQLDQLAKINITPPIQALNLKPTFASTTNNLPSDILPPEAGQAKWVSVSSVSTSTTSKIPFILYKMNFCVQCQQSPLYVFIGLFPVTAYSAYVTNKNTGFSFILSFNNQGFAVIPLDVVQKLGCGCNNVLTIIQWYTSWGRAWAAIKQSTSCFNCQGDVQGLSFFNSNTCRCNCKAFGNGSGCKGLSKLWSGYPTCSCTCIKTGDCPSTKPNYNYNTCSCDCFKKCYPWQKLDTANCKCI